MDLFKSESLLQQRWIVRVTLLVLIAYIAGGAIFYHLVEHWQWLDSVYFVVVTLATVGYGDFVPKTDEGKLFTIPYIFIGIGMFVFAANTFLKYRALRRTTLHNAKRKRSSDGKAKSND